jgi:glyoxylase-like metal-dependent hydrolase (beta-lactamase superfamily II)
MQGDDFLVVIKLKGDIWQVDLVERGIAGRTAGYFVKSDKDWLLIETGPASSVKIILEAAQILGIGSNQLKYIAVTHIHLDHAGGVGLAAQHFPEAKVAVHYKGARHLANPARLIAGTTAIWGKEKMVQFGEILPVPEEKIIGVNEGDKIYLNNRIIEIWETPGHSQNHVCFYDPKTKGLFSGDAAGTYQPRLSQTLKKQVIRPATPFPDFNAKLMLESLIRIGLSELEYIYFTHFGSVKSPQLLIEQLIGQLTWQMELARKFYPADNAATKLREEFLKQTKKGLAMQSDKIKFNDHKAQAEWDFITGQMNLSIMGILEYLKKSQILREVDKVAKKSNDCQQR